MIQQERRGLRIPPIILAPLVLLLLFAGLGVSQVSEKEWVDPYAPKNVTKRNLTGIPQIDYLTDPNLPRELKGFNLSTYPFLNKVPETLNFSCEGRKDGFYASEEYSCQLYHHCLFGFRYDFLCANYTAFDQRTFICHFVSEVDCINSSNFHHRNDALYKATTTPAPPPSIRVPQIGRRLTPKPLMPNKGAAGANSPAESPGQKDAGAADYAEDYSEDYADYPRETRRRQCRRRRGRRPAWCRRRRVRPVYYDDYDDYEEAPRQRNRDRDYYETEDEYAPQAKRRKQGRKQQRPKPKEDAAEEEEEAQLSSATSSRTTAQTEPRTEPPSSAPLDPLAIAKTREEIFTQSRAPPRIRPPVPLSERGKYNQMQGRVPAVPSTTPAPKKAQGRNKATTAKPTTPPPKGETEPEYDDDYYAEDEYDQPPSPQPLVSRKSGRQQQVVRGGKAIPSTTPPTTTTTKTTTTTTTEAPLYEYEEYEDYEENVTYPPSSTTTTTDKHHNRFVKRRPHKQQLALPDEIQETRYMSTSLSPPSSTLTPGTLDHLRIKEALEMPSRIPQLRQPYLNRPRPTLHNQQMIQPVTTSTSTTTTTTTTSEKPTSPTTPHNFKIIDGINSRFPSYDTPSTTEKTRNSRFWQRAHKATPTSTSTTTATAPPTTEDYLEYYDDVVATRYGQRSASTYNQYNPEDTNQGQFSEQADSPEPAQEEESNNGGSRGKEEYFDYNQEMEQTGAKRIHRTKGEPKEEVKLPPTKKPKKVKIRPDPYDYEMQQHQTFMNSEDRQSVLEQSNFVTPFGTTAFPINSPRTTAPSPQSSRPEFVSLLPEGDEQRHFKEPQSTPDNRRFRTQYAQHLLSPLPELFPSYAPTSRAISLAHFGPYSPSAFTSPEAPRRIAQRHIYPQMYAYY